MGAIKYLLLGLFILTSLVSFANPNLIEMFYDKDNQPTLAQVQSAIESGANVNARTESGWTALMMTVRVNKNPEIIAALIEAGSDINTKTEFGSTALMRAASNNENPKIITALINAGADTKARDKVGKTAFDYAKENKKLANTDAYWQLNDAQYK